MAQIRKPGAQAGVALLTVERALDWYLGELSSSVSAPIAAGEAEALRDALAGGVPWKPEQMGNLVAFTRAMHRFGKLGQGPGCNLGDALTALGARAAPGEHNRNWVFEPAVDPDAFGKCGYRDISLGIEKIQRENREGWWAHGKKNRAFIESAVRGTSAKKLAVALGAGAAYDLPLLELARSYEHLVLVDVDAAALNASVAAIFKDASLRAKVEPRVLDLTGIGAALVRALNEILAGPGDAASVKAGIEQICLSYRLPEGVRFLERGERADFLVSSCVLSQLVGVWKNYALRVYNERFGTVEGLADRDWLMAWTDLRLRVQQDHINAMEAAADHAVLTSDVVAHGTGYDGAGVEREIGGRSFLLASDTLAERIPTFLEITANEAWNWNHHRPPRGGGTGFRLDVEGVVLHQTT